MADINRKINYEIGFNINQSNYRQIVRSLEEINNITTSAYAKKNNLSTSEARSDLQKIRKDANALGEALSKAYNQKLNIVNIKEFNTQLENFRKQYCDLSMTNYRDYNRKRIGFTFSYQLLSKIYKEIYKK